MARINRYFKFGFLILAITAAIARWKHNDAGDMIELFCVLAVLIGFVMWALVGYIRAWSIAIGDIKKRNARAAAGQEDYQDAYWNEIPLSDADIEPHWPRLPR